MGYQPAFRYDPDLWEEDQRKEDDDKGQVAGYGMALSFKSV
jgi:hypothetical protein